MSAKTEEPTPKRLRKAREEGDSGASPFAAQAVAFVVAVTLLPPAVRAIGTRAAELARGAIGHAADRAPVAAIDAASAAGDLLGLSLPLLGAVAIAAAAGSAVQTGGMFATKKIQPKLERLDPFEGMKHLVSRARLFAVARALIGASVVAWLVTRALRAHAGDLARLAGRPEHVAFAAAAITRSLAWNAALVGLGLAAIDVVVMRQQWMRRLRMSKEDVKREAKESEGDPAVKQARERGHHEMLAAATLGNVRTAAVVIVDPPRLACALRYDRASDGQGDLAPVVVARGDGELATLIVKAARDYGVPMVQDEPLALSLQEVEIGEAIPEDLYEAVADALRDAWSEGEAPA